MSFNIKKFSGIFNVKDFKLLLISDFFNEEYFKIKESKILSAPVKKSFEF